MTYGGFPFGTNPLGSDNGGDTEKNVVNVPTALITISSSIPIVAVEFQYTTRKHNALERRSPCPT